MAAEDENVVVGLNIQGYTFNLRGKNSDMPLYKETESRLNSRIARLHNQMPQATNDQLAFMTAIMSTFDLIQQEQRFKTEETVPAGTEKRIRRSPEGLRPLREVRQPRRAMQFSLLTRLRQKRLPGACRQQCLPQSPLSKN